jgi:hypothetical protein
MKAIILHVMPINDAGYRSEVYLDIICEYDKRKAALVLKGGHEGWGGVIYEVAGSVSFPDETPIDEILLDDIYERTNSIYGHWSENKGVECSKRSMRSTSVGDIIMIGDAYYFVDSIGFDKIA